METTVKEVQDDISQAVVHDEPTTEADASREQEIGKHKAPQAVLHSSPQQEAPAITEADLKSAQEVELYRTPMSEMEPMPNPDHSAQHEPEPISEPHTAPEQLPEFDPDPDLENEKSPEPEVVMELDAENEVLSHDNVSDNQKNGDKVMQSISIPRSPKSDLSELSDLTSLSGDGLDAPAIEDPQPQAMLICKSKPFDKPVKGPEPAEPEVQPEVAVKEDALPEEPAKKGKTASSKRRASRVAAGRSVITSRPHPEDSELEAGTLGE